jgi:hypothetical protein
LLQAILHSSATVSWIGENDLKGTTMSEASKANTVAFHKKAVFEGDVENAFRLYAGGSKDTGMSNSETHGDGCYVGPRGA